MKKSVLKRTLSIVLACIMMMSIFAAIPMEAGAVRYLNTMKWTAPSTGYYAEGYAPTWDYAIQDTGLGRHLTKNDYTVTYSGSFKVGGKCTATFKGKGQYAGTVVKTFKVVKRPLSRCKVVSARDTYNGGINPGVVTPTVSLVDGNGKTRYMQRDSDYTVSVSSLFAGGKFATIYVKGVNNYTGTWQKTVNIK